MLLNSKRIYPAKQLKNRSFKTPAPQLSPGGADLLSAIPWQAAILDQSGGIIAVNEAWRRFAAEDSVSSFPESGIGLNYFDVGRWGFGLHQEIAQQAYEGIYAVLARRQALFTLEYPYPSAADQRWFQFTATPMTNGQAGALIQRLDISSYKLDKVAMDEREPARRPATAPVTPVTAQTSHETSHDAHGADPYQPPHHPFEALLAMAHTLTIPAARDGSAGAYAAAHALSEHAITMFACETVSILALDAQTQAPRPITVAARSPQIALAWQNRYERMARFGDRFDQALISRLCRDEIIVMEADPSDKYTQVAWLLAPMHSGGRLLGIVRLDYGVQPHHFTAEELSLARAFARMAALVVEQRVLHEERDQAMRERTEATTRELSASEALRQMELFIAIAGHEFRTPLTVIKGQLELAERKLSAAMPESEQAPILASACVQEALSTAQRAASRLGSLLGDLLEVTNARTGRLAIHPEWCDLVGLVRDQVASHRQLYPSRRLQLHLDGPRHIYMLADPVRLAEVLTNYLNNACKYSPASRPIRVELHVGEGVARVSVCDQGPGLAPSAQARIWERFYQVPDIKPQSGSDAGLGLGLYICRLIVEQHGGEVGVESEEGKGATFWCTIPLRMHAAS
jgi:signal transduction histidine kinase